LCHHTQASTKAADLPVSLKSCKPFLLRAEELDKAGKTFPQSAQIAFLLRSWAASLA